jgi:hypothetical protein
MSDYLWDKTGEADPEVERLESLLGGLAHRPRPLELPAAEPRARRRFPLKYAAAAAVLLAVLAGALFALRLARRGDDGAVAESAPVRTADPRESRTPPAVPPTPEGAGVPEVAPAPRGRQLNEPGKNLRRTRRPAAPASVARRPRAVGAAVAPEVADGGQRRRAKEQLVYALRLTGAKLEEVRRKVQGEGDAEAAPVGRSRTR